MACYHPITVWRSLQGRDPITKKWPIVFDIKQGYSDMEMKVPCGQCVGCRLERSRQWAIRCLHEASLHPINCFVTLTYREDDLPRGGIDLETGEIDAGDFPTLRKRDYVLFMKRLRKKFGNGIRFFHCGEYGELLGRPHHHAILFNHDFADKKVWKRNNGVVLYRSADLEELWPYGFCSVGNVTFESAAYVARYIMKKINGSQKLDHYLGIQPEYITMSRRPGIARAWYDRYKSDVYDNDYCIIRGKKLRPPKYYDKLYDLENNEGFSKVVAKRISEAKKSPDNTFDRLTVREKIQVSKSDRLIRQFY